MERFNEVMLWLVAICAICAIFTTTQNVIDTYNDNKTYTLNISKPQ